MQVINSFIRRIKEVNPLLNCVVDERFKDALEDGAQADMLIKSGRYTEKELEEKFPFLGVPFTTKDQLAVKGNSSYLISCIPSLIPIFISRNDTNSWNLQAEE